MRSVGVFGENKRPCHSRLFRRAARVDWEALMGLGNLQRTRAARRRDDGCFRERTPPDTPVLRRGMSAMNDKLECTASTVSIHDLALRSAES